MPGLHVWSSLQWGGTTNQPMGACVRDSPATSPSRLLPIACSPSYNQGRVLHYEHITCDLNRERKKNEKGKKPPNPLCCLSSPPKTFQPFLSCHLRGGLFIDIMQVLKYFSFSSLPSLFSFLPLSPPGLAKVVQTPPVISAYQPKEMHSSGLLPL